MLGFQVELSRCLTLSILRQVEGSEAVATVRPIGTMQVKNSLTVGVTANGTMPWQVEIASS